MRKRWLNFSIRISEVHMLRRCVYRYVQKVLIFGHNGGVVYAEDGRVIKWTGEKLFYLIEVLTYNLIVCVLKVPFRAELIAEFALKSNHTSLILWFYRRKSHTSSCLGSKCTPSKPCRTIDIFDNKF